MTTDSWGHACVRFPRRWVPACSPWQPPSARSRVSGGRGQRGDRAPPAAAARPGFSYGTDSWPVTVTGTAPVPGARHSAAATAATWAWPGTGRAPRGARPATSSPGRRPTRPGERQLHHVPRRHRHRRLLVHGRSRRRPALERHHRRGLPTGAQLQASRRARGDQGQVHPLPGGLGRHRAAGHRARPGQRLEQRLHLAVQRRGQAVSASRRSSTGRSSTGSPPTSPSHSTYKVGVYSSPTIWPSIFGTGARTLPSRTPTSGPTGRRPANLSAAPTGWCLHGTSTVRAVLRRADHRRASTR